MPDPTDRKLEQLLAYGEPSDNDDLFVVDLATNQCTLVPRPILLLASGYASANRLLATTFGAACAGLWLRPNANRIITVRFILALHS